MEDYAEIIGESSTHLFTVKYHVASQFATYCKLYIPEIEMHADNVEKDERTKRACELIAIGAGLTDNFAMQFTLVPSWEMVPWLQAGQYAESDLDILGKLIR